MRLTCCGLGESYTLKHPYEGINFDGVRIFLSTMLLNLPFASGKLLEESSRFLSVEHEEGSFRKGINVLLNFL
jgi:hypothetical protein